MMWLATVLLDNELCDLFEIDLRNRGIELADWFKHKVSLRKILVHACNPGPDSLVMREMQNRENFGEGVWTPEMQYIVHLANLTARIEYYSALELWRSQKKPQDRDKPKPPEPLRPPGWRKPVVKMSDPLDVRAFFGMGGINIQS